MIFKRAIFVLFIAIPSFGYTQNLPIKTLANIKSNDLKTHLEILTSDSLEGRATGEIGCMKAANYIENNFKSIGLQPGYNESYRQPFTVWKTIWKELFVVIGTDTLNFGTDFSFPGNFALNEETQKEIVFVGSVNKSTHLPENLKGKIVVVSFDDLKKTWAIPRELKKAGAWAVIGINPKDNKQYSEVSKKYNKIRQLTNIKYDKPKIQDVTNKMFIMPNSIIEKIFNKSIEELTMANKSGQYLPAKQISLTLNCDTIPVIVHNIIGKIEGTDSLHKSLAVTAHYDHIGRNSKGKICRGADDNGSGTAALLQLAQSFQQLETKPKNDILFIAFTAEEKGLWGSDYYMNKKQPSDFIANINMDMIARHDTASKDNYIYLLGIKQSPWLDSLSRKANNETVQLTLDYHYDGSSFLKRSDHYHFHRNNVPVLSFFSGLHRDYHTPRDTIDKIDFNLYRKRVQLIFASAYLIAFGNRQRN